MEKAECQGALRVLGEFHVEYLRKNGVSLRAYKQELRSLSKANPDLEFLELFIQRIQTDGLDKNEKEADNPEQQGQARKAGK
jgi:hypothetical protein